MLRADVRAIISKPCTTPRADRLLQESLGGDPWRVVIASMLLRKMARHNVESSLLRLLNTWSSATALCHAEASDVVSVCHVNRNCARRIIRFSSLFVSDGWEDLRELPGVGDYAADIVAFVCFGRPYARKTT